MPHPLTRLARLTVLLAERKSLQVNEPERAPAAVAVVFAPDPDALLLIKRADQPGDPWSGQMALPGGRFDPTDGDLRHTALRETREELGLDLSGVDFLGVLDDMAPNTSVLPPINVRPHVFVLSKRPETLVPNREVASVVWVPIDLLLSPITYRPYQLQQGAGSRANHMGYHLAEGVVWGMTERILTPLLELIRPV